MVRWGHCLMQQAQSIPVNARKLAGEEPAGREVGACPFGQPLAVPKPCRLHGAIGLLIAPSLLWDLINPPIYGLRQVRHATGCSAEARYVEEICQGAG